MDVRSGNQQFVKSMNLNKILREFRTSGVLSRVDLSRRLKLGKSTITGLVGSLIESGCVQEVGQKETGVGRNPMFLRLNPSWKHVIAMHLDTHILHMGIINLMGELVYEYRYDRSAKIGTWHHLFHYMNRVARTACSAQGLNWERDILGIAVAFPGIIDTPEGMTFSRLQKGQHSQIHKKLSAVFGKKVIVENDVRALALGAKQSAGDASDMVMVLVSEGVGAGIVTNGQLVRGGARGAGQIGHIKVADEGPKCHCGRVGCLESFIANDMILATFQNEYEANSDLQKQVGKLLDLHTAERVTVRQIGFLAKQQVPEAVKIVNMVSYRISRAIHGMVQLLNPSQILLGGPLFDEAGDIMINQIWNYIEETTQSLLYSDLSIQKMHDIDKLFLLGVGSLVLEEAFAIPLYKESGDYPISIADVLSL